MNLSRLSYFSSRIWPNHATADSLLVSIKFQNCAVSLSVPRETSIFSSKEKNVTVPNLKVFFGMLVVKYISFCIKTRSFKSWQFNFYNDYFRDSLLKCRQPNRLIVMNLRKQHIAPITEQLNESLL